MREKQKLNPMLKPIPWPLRMENCHDGMPLGNGLFGALLWFRDGTLRVTVNRADFWDHRGGFRFGPDATYANLIGMLANDAWKRILRLYRPIDLAAGRLAKPGLVEV